MPYFFLVLSWLVFGLLHSLLAAAFAKRFAMRVMKQSYKYYRLLYSLFATASLAWVLHNHFSITETIMWRPPVIEKIIAAIALLAGIAVMLVCIKKYFLYLSGIDVFMEGNTAPAALQTDGLHKYVRHPLYSGTLLFVWALFLGYPYMNSLVSCICITLYTWIGLQFEEKKLLNEYGEAYREYQGRIPALLPKMF